MTDSGGSTASVRGSAVAVLVAAAVVVAAAGFGGAVGAASGSATTEQAGSNPVKFVYVNADTDSVTFVRADGTQVDTGASASVVGPMADLDSDGLLEAPYVTSNGHLHTIDANGERQSIDSGVPSTKTKVAVGDWTGDGVPEVVYPSTNNDIYYKNVSGTATSVETEAASAVLGVADFDGDGGRDIVFVGTSQRLHYYNGTNTVDTGYGNFANSGAAGAPADFDGDGTLRVPAIDGSGIPEVVDSGGNAEQFLQSSNNTDKKPVAGVDWAGDAALEIVHLQGGEVAYTTATGETQKITDADGATMTAVQSAGVAGVASYPSSLSVSEFAASATGDQNVTVTVTTNHNLSELNVTLDGPEGATLTLADGDFSETGTDPYSYTATYDGSTDGEYTATLERAASAGDQTSGQTDTATVDDRAPSVESVNLTDATNGDGYVEASDEVTVNATVSGDIDAVTADLASFDAGTVTLTADADGDYTATATVGSDATDGDQTATVTASDGEGNTDSATTGALTVDTENLSVSLNETKTVDAGESATFSPASVSGATGDVTYDWAFGDGDTATGETVTHTYADNGTYTVEVTATDEAGDTASDTMTVSVEDPPVVESVSLTDATDGNGTVSPGDEVRVNATVSGSVDSVTADLSAFDAGTVTLTTDADGDYTATAIVGTNVAEGAHAATVTATGTSGTEDSATTGTLDVVVDELTVSIGDDRTVGVNETVAYEASVAGATGDVTYDWTLGNGDTATGERVEYAFEERGTYTVEVTATDDAGSDTDAVSVTVVDPPVVESVNLTDATNGDGYVEAGDEVRVNATVSGDIDAVTADLTAFDAGTIELTADADGDYTATATVGPDTADGEQTATVVATGTQGNEDTDETRALTVDTDPLSVSLNDTKTVGVGESATFSPESVSGATGSVSYEWAFGDGDTATGETVTHTFGDAGSYDVVLTASDGTGDTDTASLAVTVTTDTTTTTTTTTEPASTTTTPTDDPTTTAPTTTTSDSSDDDGGSDWTAPSGSDSGGSDATATTTAEQTGDDGTVTRTTREAESTTTATETTRATETTTERTPTATETTTAPPGADNVPPQSPGEAPGFGPVAALLALLAAAGLALRE